MSNSIEILRQLYSQFNAREMEAVLASLHPEVVWANGMEGGYVHSRDGVREYWTRQWAMIDPHVEPVNFTEGDDETIEVEVHQVVRDLEGRVLLEKTVGHIFRLESGLVRRFDIR
ncbi:MAG: nuclear transport factor 2 family protein [Terracidiphilus sp.]